MLPHRTVIQNQLSNSCNRLNALHLPMLKYRRYRGNMIEVFKIIKGIYDLTCVPHFGFVELFFRTRGNKYQLTQHHCHDLRKFNFTNWVIPIWNSLPNQVVSAETVNNYSGRLLLQSPAYRFSDSGRLLYFGCVIFRDVKIEFFG